MREILLIKTVKTIKNVFTMLQKLNFRIINKKAYFNYNTTQFLNNSVGFRSKTVVKTQNYAVKDKENDILKEAQIVKYLNENGAKTAPRLIKQGKTFSKKDYIILEKIKNKEGYLLSDLLFALLEQKAFGVWHGDIKPSNIFFNGSYVVLIDYDQAKIIPEIKDMTNIEFLNFIANDLTSKWSDYLEKNYYVYSKEQFVALFEPFLKNGSFNMGTTTIFGAQKTTHTDTGFYHAIKTDKVFIDGVRNLDARKPILDLIPIKKDEKILDFGCNAGLLSHYLYDRGAKVFACDMDKNIVNAGQMVANILNKKINFFKCDIDIERFCDNFDTICLFSVIHHTQFMENNAKFLASKAKRIIIECRLNEFGEKPTDKGWIKTSKWNFQNVEQLHSYLEKLFPNFKFEKNWGQNDRQRYIITLIKR